MKGKEVIIGSTALRYWYPEFPRDPSDIDTVVEDLSGKKNSKGLEYHLNPVILSYEDGVYAKPSTILTLKLSHMFWDINLADGKGA